MKKVFAVLCTRGLAVDLLRYWKIPIVVPYIDGGAQAYAELDQQVRVQLPSHLPSRASLHTSLLPFFPSLLL